MEDVNVIELHDCFSTNELITYEALVCVCVCVCVCGWSNSGASQGLCEEGKGGSLIDEGEVTYGGKWVVNPR